VHGPANNPDPTVSSNKSNADLLMTPLHENLENTASTLATSPPPCPQCLDTNEPTPADTPTDAIPPHTHATNPLCHDAERDNTQLNLQLAQQCKKFTQAFDAIRNIATCNAIPDALHTLALTIARVVNCRFTFYDGPYLSQLGTCPTRPDLPDHNIATLAPSETLPLAQKFYDDHHDDLQKLLTDPQPFQATLIGYDDDTPDPPPGGCVLTIPLASDNHAHQHIGTLLFVRDDNQTPFLPLDVSLARSLADAAAAVIRSSLFAQKLPEAFLQTIVSLVRAVEAKDAYTSGHSTRVAQLACQLGRHIGIEEHQIQLLHWAGLMHDIGKIGIRDDVLRKPGKLTPEEFDHIKTHPVKSCKVLEPIKALTPILDAVRHHHEHWDGNGYPAGLAGNDIPPLARVLQVADVWDALTSTRSYRNAMSKEKALTVIRSMAGSTLDPILTQQFLHLMEDTNHEPH